MSGTALRCVLQYLAASVAQWDWAPALQSGNVLANASFPGFLASPVSLVYVRTGAYWNHLLSKLFAPKS